MGAISSIKGVVLTNEDKYIYIKSYYCNGSVVKIVFSDKEDDNMSFSGTKVSKMAIAPPNFNPLCNIRDVCKKCRELKYLGVKSVLYYEIEDKDNGKEIVTPLLKKVPNIRYKRKKLKSGAKVEISDEINNLYICTKIK